MNKDFDLKNDPFYRKLYLRQKVAERTKRLHDAGEEVKQAFAKVMLDAPLDSRRCTEDRYKHYCNK